MPLSIKILLSRISSKYSKHLKKIFKVLNHAERYHILQAISVLSKVVFLVVFK
jgi:hypothetical protein